MLWAGAGGFNAGQVADLLVTRAASGQFTVSIDGVTSLNVLDDIGVTTFLGPDNTIWFFVDDFQSLFFYPDTPEAGSGFIDFINVTSDVAPVPLPATLPLFASGLIGLGWLSRRRRKQAQAAA